MADVLSYPSDIEEKPAIILDWDGTIRKPKSGEFIEDADDLEFYDGVISALWKYKRAGYLVLGATNQGGIAYNHKTIYSFAAEVGEMKLASSHEQGWPFDDWHFSPYMKGGEDKSYSRSSLMRKPNYGMLALMEHRLIKEYGVAPDWDSDRTFMVGDSYKDRELASKVGILFAQAEDWRKDIKRDNFQPEPPINS